MQAKQGMLVSSLEEDKRRAPKKEALRMPEWQAILFAGGEKEDKRGFRKSRLLAKSKEVVPKTKPKTLAGLHRKEIGSRAPYHRQMRKS
tara:strand:- start:5363 stop:5629 length:267 start_codon:yes stop_codon:yes gene_type:complete